MTLEEFDKAMCALKIQRSPPTLCGWKDEKTWWERMDWNGVLYALYRDLRRCFTNHWSQPLGDYNVPRLDRENIAKKGENMLTCCGIFRSLLFGSTHLQWWVLEVSQYIVFKASPLRTVIEGRVEASQFNGAPTRSFPEQFLFKATNSQVFLLHSVGKGTSKSRDNIPHWVGRPDMFFFW